MKLFFTSILASMALISGAQNSNYWHKTAELNAPMSQRWISPQKSLTYQLELSALKQVLAKTSLETTPILSTPKTAVSIPFPDGSMHTFLIWESSTMAKELQAKFPEIRTYMGYDQSNSSVSIKLDCTPAGFHAMILGSEPSTVFIDPHLKNNTEYYSVYFKNEYGDPLQKGAEFKCGLTSDNVELRNNVISNDKKINLKSYSNPKTEGIGTELRTYRIAVAATKEFTNFHGGTVTAGLAAVVTSMNRVNGVYEKELAARMNLVANNNLIIYTTSNPGPYSNNNASALLTQNQTNLTSVIGSANYDIGHVMNTGGGGLASLASICSSTSKAQGQTGSSQPVGDPYDIDYVAHEIGHQYGGNHTFNGSSGSCSGGNRNASTAYEPGSGSTIMAYAGICGSHDLQTNSDAYFHNISYIEITNNLARAAIANCPVKTQTGNLPPVVDAGPGGYMIPKSTPFRMVASGSDPNGDQVFYCWEQMDLGAAGDPKTPTGTAPLFRSFKPTTNPERVFPKWANILANSTTVGEVMQTTARTLNFRVTARDNKVGGGGVEYDTTKIFTTDQAGPFIMTSQGSASTWTIGQNYTITWNVANTNLAPCNTQNVNIRLSLDTAKTFPIYLATSVPNTGSYTITLPSNAFPSTRGRIMVEAANSIYFDVNDSWVTVVQPAQPSFTFQVNNPITSACLGDTVSYKFITSPISNFGDSIYLTFGNLNPGITPLASKYVMFKSDTVTMQFIIDTSVVFGNQIFTVYATGNTIIKDLTLTIGIVSNSPNAPTLTTPMNNATLIGLRPQLVWAGIPGAKNYLLEISTDSSFNTIVYTTTLGAINTLKVPIYLQGNIQHWWRMQTIGACGTGTVGMGNTFTTEEVTCNEFNKATALPISSTSSNVYTQSILVSGLTGFVQYARIENMNISHTNIGDLEMFLTSPEGKTIKIYSRNCNNSADMLLSFSDDGNLAINCPPTDNLFVKPSATFSTLTGGNPNGEWKLTISDLTSLNGGQLNSWNLVLCTKSCIGVSPITISANPNNSNICQSGFASVSVSASSSLLLAYQWMLNGNPIPNATGSNYTIINGLPNQTGVYTCEISNACASKTSNPATINVYATPATPTLSYVSGFLQSSAATGNQWYFNNVGISGAVGTTYTPTQSGAYNVRVTENNCTSDWSNSFTFNVGVISIPNGELTIYPNPTSDIVRLNLNTETYDLVIEVMDVKGSIISSKRYSKLNSGTIEVSLPESTGLYLLRMKTPTWSHSEKIIKK